MAAPAKPAQPETSPAEPAKKRVDPRHRKVWWRDALTSYWAPICALGIALIPYLFLVELHTSSHLWARPVLKGFAFLMFLWFVGLAAFRAVFPRERKLRKLRTESRELMKEVRPLLDKHGSNLEPKIRRKITDALEAVDEAALQGDFDKLDAELKRLADLTEKHLGAHRPNRTVTFVVGIVKALAVALVIRTVLIEPYKIPSSSMIPTLEIGDQIFINKFIYGVRIPFTNKVPFVIVRKPKRGDIVVFENPYNSSVDLVKRVVAIEGDRIESRDKQLYINGEPQPLRVVDPSYTIFDLNEANQWEARRVVLLEETLDGTPHPVLHHPSRPEPDWEFTVPEGTVFFMGDNRDNSADSRVGFAEARGLTGVPLGHLKGKAMIVWLALGHDGIGSSLFGGTGFRTDRLFMPVR